MGTVLSRQRFPRSLALAAALSGLVGFVAASQQAVADCFEKDEEECRCRANDDADMASCTANEVGGKDECEAYFPVRIGCKHTFDSCNWTSTASSDCPVNWTPTGECWDLERMQCRPCEEPPPSGCGGGGS